jgi:hypothetical protein
MEQKNIVVTKKFIEGLKKSYDAAVLKGLKQFTYNDHQFITAYAKYFVEYYAPIFNIKL